MSPFNDAESLASTYAGSMSLANPEDAANDLESLSDEDIINDDANYMDEDIESDWTDPDSQEQREWVNPYGNTDDLDTKGLVHPL